MKPLILDCHAQLPLWRRMGRATANALGWAFWAYMWLPLVGLLVQDLGLDAESEPCPEGEVSPLFQTVYWHASIFACWGGLFLTWAVLQWYEREHRAPRQQSLVTTRQLAHSIRLSEEGLDAWQRTQRIVVWHDEASGWICSAFCADSLLPLDNPKQSPRKRFIILYDDSEQRYKSTDSLVSAPTPALQLH